MKLQDLKDETSIRAALRSEFAEAWPDGYCGAFGADGAPITADEWVEENFKDVMKGVAML